MDLSTTYLGLKLSHPFMPGASPMVDDLGLVRRLEDAGAAAIVMHSLFEEQLPGEQAARRKGVVAHAGGGPGEPAFRPTPGEFTLGPDEYLEQLAKIKKAVRVPVIASLNGTTAGQWIHYARLMEQAGADALELNVYSIAADPWDPPQAIERRLLDLVRAVRSMVKCPLAVKLSPFYTSIPHLAMQLESAGVDGLVLFNRFYQADVDAENLNVVRTLHLSDSSELLLRLRWLAILSGRIRPSLAVSGGIHCGLDAVKAVMCGAHAVQMVSALLRRGPEFLRDVRAEMVAWMEKHDHVSLAQLRGTMNLLKCPYAKAYERANYARVLQYWRGIVRSEEPPEECFE